MNLPLAHLGHFLWIFYVVPVLIVVGGIIKSSLSAKRKDRPAEAEDDEAGEP